MDALLSQLHDINGLDKISWWPPAPGWIAVTLICLAIVLFVGLKASVHNKKKKNLEDQLIDKCEELERCFSDIGTKEAIGELSKLIRVIAMSKFGRDQCASLTQTEWLAFLTEKDPKGFNWKNHAGFLEKALYAPQDTKFDKTQFLKLLHAIKAWI